MRKRRIKTSGWKNASASSLHGGRKGKEASLTSFGRVVGYGSVGLFGIATLAMLFPMVGMNTSASEPSTDSIMSTSVNTNTVALVRSSIAVALSSAVNFDITPQSNGAFSTSAADLMVTTNNTTGYQVYLQTLDNSSQLNPVKSGVETSIMPVAGELDSTNYHSKLNTWGYRVGTTEGYTAVPKAGDTPIIRTEGSSREDSYTLGFAVAVGADLPSGVYKNELVASVVANPVEVRSLNDITYMQEMTPEICTISYVDETKQLIDTRDGKSYWVAKLKDGNCWMVQNLALDLDVNEAGNAVAVSENGKIQELNSNNTDITDVWKGATKTEYEIPEPNTKSYYTTRSWNLGKIILTNPTASKLCPTQTPPNDGNNYTNTDMYNSAFHGQKITETCPTYYKDVENMTTGYIATETSSISPDEKSYDAHYLIGNYYQYNTATAGTGIGLTGTNATGVNGEGLTNASGSICPRGWELSKGGSDIATKRSLDIDDSYFRLLKNYGYNTGWVDSWMPISIGTNLSWKPIYIARTGIIGVSGGALRFAGDRGVISSSTVYPGDGTSIVYPSNDIDKSIGISVRCLAR